VAVQPDGRTGRGGTAQDPLPGRFAVAEDLIRLHDIARLWYRLGLEPSAKWSVDLLELERRFDELAPRTIRGIDTVDLPDWDLVSPEPEPVGQGER
jgi:hypothetical protein